MQGNYLPSPHPPSPTCAPVQNHTLLVSFPLRPFDVYSQFLCRFYDIRPPHKYCAALLLYWLRVHVVKRSCLAYLAAGGGDASTLAALSWHCLTHGAQAPGCCQLSLHALLEQNVLQTVGYI